MLSHRKASETPGKTEEEIKSEESKEKANKFPKKRLVLGIGYNGLNFHGSQKQLLSSSQNTPMRTVESELQTALYKAGMIAPYNYGDLSKIKFGRATRTDKRVHALINYFSAKLLVDPTKSLEELIKLIQSHCPNDMHVVSVNTSGRAFNVKNSVAYRLYDYYLPTFLLKPLSISEQESIITELEGVKAQKVKQKEQEEEKKERKNENENQQTQEETKEVKDRDKEEEHSIDGDLRRQFGISFQDQLQHQRYKTLRQFQILGQQGHLEKVKSLFQFYEGTKKYHNFTRKMTYKDSSANRYILKMTVSDPFKIKDMQFLRVTLKGQSFLYNQIRKMMGAVIQICRWGLKAQTLENYFKGNATFVPTAPGEGLMLNRISFDNYNKVKVKNEEGRIEVSEEMEKRINKFREQLIESIGAVEQEKHNFMKWLIWLDLHIAEERIF